MMAKTYLLVIDKDDKDTDNLSRYENDLDFLGSLQLPFKDNKIECHTITRSAFNKIKQNADVEFHLLDNTSFINKYLKVEENTSIIIVTIKKNNATGEAMNQQDDVLNKIFNELTSIRKDVGKLQDDVKRIEAKVDSIDSRLTNVEKDVAVLKSDVATLKTDVADLKTDMAKVKEDVSLLKSEARNHG